MFLINFFLYKITEHKNTQNTLSRVGGGGHS